MNISLTPELEALVHAKVASGLYNNASEVIREALRLLHDKDHLKELKKQYLQQELQIGLKALEGDEIGNRTLDQIREDVLKNNGSRT